MNEGLIDRAMVGIMVSVFSKVGLVDGVRYFPSASWCLKKMRKQHLWNLLSVESC